MVGVCVFTIVRINVCFDICLIVMVCFVSVIVCIYGVPHRGAFFDVFKSIQFDAVWYGNVFHHWCFTLLLLCYCVFVFFHFLCVFERYVRIRGNDCLIVLCILVSVVNLARFRRAMLLPLFCIGSLTLSSTIIFSSLYLFLSFSLIELVCYWIGVTIVNLSGNSCTLYIHIFLVSVIRQCCASQKSFW